MVTQRFSLPFLEEAQLPRSSTRTTAGTYRTNSISLRNARAFNIYLFQLGVLRGPQLRRTLDSPTRSSL
jgi:hypothetical protein